MNIFQRAAARLPLTPSERASMRMFYSLVIHALVIGGWQGYSYATSQKFVDVRSLLMVVVVGCFNTLALGLHKYATANGDAAFMAAAGVVSQEAQALQDKGTLEAPAVDLTLLLPAIEAVVAKWVSAVDPIAAAPVVAQHLVAALKSDFAQQKASQQSAAPAPAPVRINTPPPSQAAPVPSQAPVMPMTVQTDVSRLQTAMMPAVQPAQDTAWMTMGPPQG